MGDPHWSAAKPPRSSPPGRPRPSGAGSFRDENLPFRFADIRAQLRGNAGGYWRFVAIFSAALGVEVNVVEDACEATLARRLFRPMRRSSTPARDVRRPDSLTFDLEDSRPLSTSREAETKSSCRAQLVHPVRCRGTRHLVGSGAASTRTRAIASLSRSKNSNYLRWLKISL